VLGSLWQAGDERGFTRVQLLHLFPEVIARGFLDAVAATAEVDLVQIEGEDFLLAERILQPPGQDDLLELALESPLRGQEKRLHDLLRDRGRALFLLARAQVDDQRPNHAQIVDAFVLEEVGVFGRDHRVNHDLGDLLERHVGAALGEDLTDDLSIGGGDARDLLGMVVAERGDRGQARIAAVVPEQERDDRGADRRGRQRADAAPLQDDEGALLARARLRLRDQLLGGPTPIRPRAFLDSGLVHGCCLTSALQPAYPLL